MNIQIQVSNIRLADSQKDYITEKISHLAKFDERIADESSLVHVSVKGVEHENTKEKVEIDIRMKVPGGEFFAQDIGITPEETIDKAVVKFRHQLEKYKGKHEHLHDQPLEISEEPEY